MCAISRAACPLSTKPASTGVSTRQTRVSALRWRPQQVGDLLVEFTDDHLQIAVFAQGLMLLLGRLYLGTPVRLGVSGVLQALCHNNPQAYDVNSCQAGRRIGAESGNYVFQLMNLAFDLLLRTGLTDSEHARNRESGLSGQTVPVSQIAHRHIS